MNPVLLYDNERSNLAITPEEYVQFLGDIFPYWWKNKHRFMDVEPFISYTRIFQKENRSMGCVDSGGCAYNHLMIDPNGYCSQCGRASDWNLLSYRNIADRSIFDILNDSQRKDLIKRNDILINGDCNGCDYWNICHGGCPLDAYSEHKDMMKKTSWCISKKMFLDKYFIPVTGLSL
jgi:uncharacterized protein